MCDNRQSLSSQEGLILKTSLAVILVMRINCQQIKCLFLQKSSHYNIQHTCIHNSIDF